MKLSSGMLYQLAGRLFDSGPNARLIISLWSGTPPTAEEMEAHSRATWNGNVSDTVYYYRLYFSYFSAHLQDDLGCRCLGFTNMLDNRLYADLIRTGDYTEAQQDLSTASDDFHLFEPGVATFAVVYMTHTSSVTSPFSGNYGQAAIIGEVGLEGSGKPFEITDLNITEDTNVRFNKMQLRFVP